MTLHVPSLTPAARAGVRTAVAVVVLVALAFQVGAEPFLRGVGAVSLPTVGAALGLTALATAAAVWRWRILAGRLGVPIPAAAAWAAYYRSQFLNSVLPGGVVGDVHRAIAHGRRSGRLADASRAVVAERVVGQIVQLVAAVAVLAVLGIRLDAPPWGVALLVVALLTAVAAVLCASRRARGAVRREREVAASVLGDVVTLVRVTIASLVVVGAHATVFVIACLAVGTTADPASLTAVALVTVLAGSLPVSVGGWGTREAVAAWAFTAMGLTAADGVAASTAFGVLATIAVLPGAVVLAVGVLPSRAPRNGSARGASTSPVPSISLRKSA